MKNAHETLKLAGKRFSDLNKLTQGTIEDLTRAANVISNAGISVDDFFNFLKRIEETKEKPDYVEPRIKTTDKNSQNCQKVFNRSDGELSYTVGQREKGEICRLAGRLSLPKHIHIPEGLIGDTAWQIYRFHEEFYEFKIPIHSTHALLLVPKEAFNLLRLLQPQITIY